MEDLYMFCCLDPDCPKYGQRGAGNIAVRARYGPHDRRLLYCKTCKERFSERKGTPLFEYRLDEAVAHSVLAHLREGCGVRQTERLVGVDRNTVMRLAREAGKHAKDAHDELVGFSPSTTRLQLDEKWSFVGKKEKNCSPLDEADACLGEQWDFVALDPDSRLVLSVVVGKRVGETAVMLLEDVRRRLGGRTPELVTSDEWSAYPEAIREVFGREVTPEPTAEPGRPAGTRVEVPAGLNYATVHKTRAKGRAAGASGADRDGADGGGREVAGRGEGEHVVHREAERNGPAPERPEEEEDLLLQQGLGDARGDDGLYDVQPQLLPAGQDAKGEGFGRAVATTDSGDGRGLDGSRVVVEGVGLVSCLSTVVRHHPIFRSL